MPRAPSPEYGDIVLSAAYALGPTSHWRLGEATGNFIDSGLANFHIDGTANGVLYRGAPDLAGTDGAILGSADPTEWGSVRYGGVGQYNQAGDGSYWSVAAWVQFDPAGGSPFIIDNVGGDGTPVVYSGWRLWIYGTDAPKLSFGIWAGAAGYMAVEAPYPTDPLPHHVAASIGVKGDIIALYIDGERVASATRTLSPAVAPSGNYLNTSPHSTTVDELSFWLNVQFTDEDISSLYWAGTTQWPLPPYPANGNVFIQIYGPDNQSGIWNTARWNQDLWAGFKWHDITPESMILEAHWGADDPQGVLSICAAGSWSIKTYDPQRMLDPSNGNSPFIASLRPGRPIRIYHWTPATAEQPSIYQPVRTGLIDEIDYNLIDKTGEIRGTDGIALLANAQILPGTAGAVPNTLVARTRHLLQHVNMTHLFGLYGLAPDPEVGPFPVDKEISVWTALNDAAFDCLHAVWLDRNADINFRPYGNPVDTGFAVGADGIPLETMDVTTSLSNVYTRIVGYDVTAPENEVVAYDVTKATIYGDITLRRQDPVPLATQWVEKVLADRSGATLQYLPGVLFPQTQQDLIDILQLGMLDIMHIRINRVSPPIDVPVRVLGGVIKADTGTGWTAELTGYIPASEWDAITSPPTEPPDEIPPDPNPPPTKVVTRTYNCTKSTTVMYESSDGGYYGAGKNPVNPFGRWQGDKFRTFYDFETINFDDVVAVQRCDLKVTNSDQNNVGFGSDPKVIIKRVTEDWQEGTYGTGNNYGNNATVWPGPNCTNTDSVTKSVSRSENAKLSFALTNICRSWMRGSGQFGLGLFSAGEDNEKYTGEFWSHENSTSSKRPSLSLTLEVLA